LKQMNWANIKARFGEDKFVAKFGNADLIGFVNWTMLTAMSDIWSSVLKEICPGLKGPRRKLFIDLADPEKRTSEDILRALELVAAFQKYFDVILGLNEKEGDEIGRNLGLNTSDHSPEGLIKLCMAIHQRVQVDTLVIHPTAYALARPSCRGRLRRSPKSRRARATISTRVSAWESCWDGPRSVVFWRASRRADFTCAPGKARRSRTWTVCCAIGRCWM